MLFWSNSKGFQEDMIENEVKILRMISHPNIIYLVEDHDTKHMLYLVCEYVAGMFIQISTKKKQNHL